MPKSIEIDEHTHLAIEFAAAMGKTTPGEIVARLVAAAGMPKPASTPTAAVTISVFADYAGHRTHGQYDPVTTRIDITTGPLAGSSYKSPSAAAGAVIHHFNPAVNPSRSGPAMWRLADGTHRSLGEAYPSARARRRNEH